MKTFPMGRFIMFQPRLSCSRDGGCLTQSVGSTVKVVTRAMLAKANPEIWWKVEIGYRMLEQPSRRFEGVPIVFRSRPSRPKGITGRRSTQLYFATVVCLFPESLVILCHARCGRSWDEQ